MIQLFTVFLFRIIGKFGAGHLSRTLLLGLFLVRVLDAETLISDVLEVSQGLPRKMLPGVFFRDKTHVIHLCCKMTFSSVENTLQSG